MNPQAIAILIMILNFGTLLLVNEVQKYRVKKRKEREDARIVAYSAVQIGAGWYVASIRADGEIHRFSHYGTARIDCHLYFNELHKAHEFDSKKSAQNYAIKLEEKFLKEINLGEINIHYHRDKMIKEGVETKSLHEKEFEDWKENYQYKEEEDQLLLINNYRDKIL